MMKISMSKIIIFLIFVSSLQFLSINAQAEKGLQESDALLKLENIRLKEEKLSRWLEESKRLWFLGTQGKTKEKKLKYYEEGAALDEKILRIAPTHSGAMLWLATNLGGIASTKKNLSSLKIVRQVEKILLELKKLDPDFHFRAADRALGRIYLEAPSFISIGSRKKAKEHLTEAINKFPNFAGNQISYAWFLLKNNDKMNARRLALSVLKSPQLEIYLIDRLGDWNPIAKTILDQTEEKSP